MATFKLLGFVVLASCILCGQAAPTVLDNEIEELPSNDEQMRETFAEIVSSILRPMVDRIKLVFYRERMSMMIWIEFYTIATGSHFGMLQSNVNESVDWQLHRTAMAVSELWLKLETMEKMQVAIGESSIEVGELVGHVLLKQEPFDPTVVRDIVPLVMEKIELKLSEDPALYLQYTSVKSGIGDASNAHFTYFAGSQMTRKEEKLRFDKWYSHPQIRKFLVNKVFVQMCLRPVPTTDNAEHEPVVLAKALVQLAKVENRTDEVNRIYMETVVEVASQFDLSAYPFVYRRNMDSLGNFNPGVYAKKTIPVLFKLLAAKFAENKMLNLELLAMKKTVEGLAIFRNWEQIISNQPF